MMVRTRTYGNRGSRLDPGENEITAIRHLADAILIAGNREVGVWTDDGSEPEIKMLEPAYQLQRLVAGYDRRFHPGHPGDTRGGNPGTAQLIAQAGYALAVDADSYDSLWYDFEAWPDDDDGTAEAFLSTFPFVGSVDQSGTLNISPEARIAALARVVKAEHKERERGEFPMSRVRAIRNLATENGGWIDRMTAQVDDWPGEPWWRDEFPEGWFHYTDSQLPEGNPWADNAKEGDAMIRVARRRAAGMRRRDRPPRKRVPVGRGRMMTVRGRKTHTASRAAHRRKFSVRPIPGIPGSGSVFYANDTAWTTKARAKTRAAQLRADGVFQARVVPIKGGYRVWSRLAPGSIRYQNPSSQDPSGRGIKWIDPASRYYVHAAALDLPRPGTKGRLKGRLDSDEEQLRKEVKADERREGY